MRTKAIIFFATVCILVASSCTPTKYLAVDDVSEITDITLISPLAIQDYLDSNGMFVYSDSLSEASAELLTNAFEHSSLPISKVIPITYDKSNTDLQNSIASLINITAKKAENMTIPTDIDNLLEANGQRYGLVVFSNGFTRDKKGYRKDAVKGAFIGVFTAVISGGAASAYALPIKYTLHIFMAIYDSETDKIIYFNKSMPQETDPFNEKSVRQQVDKMVKKFR